MDEKGETDQERRARRAAAIRRLQIQNAAPVEILGPQWTPPRSDCGSCGAAIIAAEHASPAGAGARADTVFELAHRGSAPPPGWITEETPFWALFDEDPWKPAAIGEDPPQTRICDERGGYLFIRPCPACGSADPLGLGEGLSARGLRPWTPPHRFVRRMRADLEKRRRGALTLDAFRAAASDAKAAAPETPEPLRRDPCPACGAPTAADARFCGQCGHALRGA